MDDHIYKIIQLTGSSTTSMEDAIRNAVSRAGKTVRHMRWFEVVESRGAIEDDQSIHWQVTLKIGFRLEDSSNT
jgi:dodecin